MALVYPTFTRLLKRHRPNFHKLRIVKGILSVTCELIRIKSGGVFEEMFRYLLSTEVSHSKYKGNTKIIV